MVNIRLQLQKPKLCPVCKGGRVVKHGITVTKGHGKRQRFLCQECASTFYGEEVV